MNKKSNLKQRLESYKIPASDVKILMSDKKYGGNAGNHAFDAKYRKAKAEFENLSRLSWTEFKLNSYWANYTPIELLNIRNEQVPWLAISNEEFLLFQVKGSFLSEEKPYSFLTPLQERDLRFCLLYTNLFKQTLETSNTVKNCEKILQMQQIFSQFCQRHNWVKDSDKINIAANNYLQQVQYAY